MYRVVHYANVLFNLGPFLTAFLEVTELKNVVPVKITSIKLDEDDFTAQQGTRISVCVTPLDQ
jgi:hypothetical protein